MKRVIFTLFASALLLNAGNTAFAGIFPAQKSDIKHAKIEKNNYKEIEQLLTTQEKFAQIYDLEGIKTIYGKEFVNNDGFKWDVYFNLIEETWKNYPDITYTTKINKIDSDGEYAVVLTSEKAVATTSSEFPVGEVFGELNSTSECIYYLRKIGNEWKITGEQVLKEISSLKFGDARYVKMTFDAPKMVGAGETYTSTIKVHVPSNNIVIGALSQEKIVPPIGEPDEKFRPFSDSQTLTRIFSANTDNVNEYNVASVALTEAEPTKDGNIKVYMSGLAFVMTRVNVVPTNNFAKVKEKDEQESK